MPRHLVGWPGSQTTTPSRLYNSVITMACALRQLENSEIAKVYQLRVVRMLGLKLSTRTRFKPMKGASFFRPKLGFLLLDDGIKCRTSLGTVRPPREAGCKAAQLLRLLNRLISPAQLLPPKLTTSREDVLLATSPSTKPSSPSCSCLYETDHTKRRKQMLAHKSSTTKKPTAKTNS